MQISIIEKNYVKLIQKNTTIFTDYQNINNCKYE